MRQQANKIMRFQNYDWLTGRGEFLCMVLMGVMLHSSLLTAEDRSGFPASQRSQQSGRATRSDAIAPPSKWDSQTNVRWKQPIAGRGWSSPLVLGDRIILTTAVAGEPLEEPKKGLYFGGNRVKPREANQSWQVVCLDTASGSQIWKCELASGLPKSAIHLKNSYASETPVTDGESIYAYFGACGLFCLDLDGNVLWENNPGQFKMRDGWGTSSSPVVDDSYVFVLCDNEQQSFLVAYDKLTGDEIWRREREEKSSWASPFLWHNSQRTELVTAATGAARSYDPKSGALLWELPDHSSIVVPTPIVGDDLLYLSSGFVMDTNRPIYAVRPGGKGDISLEGKASSNQAVAWKQSKAGPYNTTPLYHNGALYILLDRGFLVRYDATDGKQTGKRVRIGSRSGFTSSPWAYDGKVFCLNEDGVCYVFTADEELELLHRNDLGEMCMASPAIADGNLFIRTADHLYAIGPDQAVPKVARKVEQAK